MTYNEEKGNLFDLPKDEYVFAHCIAADLHWGAGIAPVLIEDEFDAEAECRYKKSGGLVEEQLEVGQAQYIDVSKGKFFNLISKEFTYEKPTYLDLRACLEDMKWQCEKLNLNKIAMPRIGCGLDGLSWQLVSRMINEVFANTDFEIQIRFI